MTDRSTPLVPATRVRWRDRVLRWSVLAPGTRHFRTDPGFASWSILDRLTPVFPPALITVGNADPLRPHSELLAERLRAQGVEVETVFFPPDHEPPLGHEYQFDLDSAEGQLFLDRLLGFLRRRVG